MPIDEAADGNPTVETAWINYESAASIIVGEEIIAAAQEEKFAKKKEYTRFSNKCY